MSAKDGAVRDRREMILTQGVMLVAFAACVQLAITYTDSFALGAFGAVCMVFWVLASYYLYRNYRYALRQLSE